MQAHPKLSLVEYFKDLLDPRVQGRTDHELIVVLIIALCTLLCGGTGFDDMADFGRAKDTWFKTFLTLRNGIPSHDTFNLETSVIEIAEWGKSLVTCGMPFQIDPIPAHLAGEWRLHTAKSVG